MAKLRLICQMLLLQLFFHFIICDEIANKICIYKTSKPSICNEIVSIDASSSNLDSSLSSILSNVNVLMFSPDSYSLKAETFEKLTVNFTSTDSNQKFDLSLSFSKDETRAIVYFQKCNLHISTNDNNIIPQFDMLEISNDCALSYTGNEKKLNVQSLVINSYVTLFDEIVVNGGFRNPDITIDYSDLSNNNDLDVQLNQREVVLDDKTIITFPNEKYNDIEIIGVNKLVFSEINNNLDTIPSCSLQNIDTVEFTSEASLLMDGYIITGNNISNVLSDSSTIPMTLKGASNSNTNIYVGNSLMFLGDISMDTISFIKKDDDGHRCQVAINGVVKTNQIIMNSSYIDLQILDLDFNFNDNFVHCIGRGGVSTIMAYTNYSGHVYLETPLFIRDFNTYLKDEELSKLLEQNLPYFTLYSLNNDLDSYATPSPRYDDNAPFVHGFSNNDNVITITRTITKNQNKIEDSIYATSPSLKSLTLCVNEKCNGQTIQESDLSNGLVDNYIFDGMKNVNIQLNKVSSVSSIDLSSIYEGINLTIISSNYPAINNLKLRQGINVTLLCINLPSFLAENTSLNILSCKFISSTNKITLTKGSNLTIDSSFITNGYYSDKISAITDNSINILSIQIDSFTQIQIQSSQLLLKNNATLYSIDTNSVKFSQVNLYADIYNSHEIIFDAALSSQTFIPFNLYLSMSKTYSDSYNIFLINWTNIQQSTSQNINLYHGIIPINMILSEPVYIDPIILNGTGKVTYINNYKDSKSICSIPTLSDKDAFEQCTNADEQVTFDQLNDQLISIQDIHNLTIYIANSNQNEYPTVKMSSLNRKVTSFIGLGSDISEYICIDNENQLSDTKLSTTYFTNLNIVGSSSIRGTTFEFGELKFENCEIADNFNDASFIVDDFISDAAFFSKIKNITITDSLVISGDFNSVDKIVYFENDDNAEDLTAIITNDEISVIVGEGHIKIGKMTFQISHSNVFDIVLDFPNKITKTVNFEAANGAELDKIPLVKINQCDEVTFNFSSSEYWPVAKRDEFIFNFDRVSDATFIINKENMPIKIEGLHQESSIIATSEKVGISGLLSNSKNSLDLSFSSTLPNTTNVQITIYEMDVFSNFNLDVLQPNVNVNINHLIDNDDGTSKQITLYLCNGLYGNSYVLLDDINGKISIASSLHILLQIDVDLESDKLAQFCEKNYTLVQTSIELEQSLNLILIQPEPSLHGISDAFAVYQNKETKEIYFYTLTAPQKVPLQLCYKSSFNCEATITDDLLSDMSSIIPAGVKAFEIGFGGNVDSSYVNFDLDVFQDSDIHLLSKMGSGTPSITIKLGFNKINQFTIEDVSININEGFQVDSLYIKNSLINKVDGFNQISIGDKNSWKQRQFTEFKNPITIVTDTQSINFVSNGWEFDNEIILSSNFPKLSINFSSTTLAFSPANNLQSINKITINAENVQKFVIQNGWSSESLSFSLGVLSNEYHVEAHSFPFYISPLNNSLAGANHMIDFANDISIKSSQFSIQNSVLLIDNSLKTDTSINDILIENSSIENTNRIQFQTLTVKDVSKISDAKISKNLIIDGESTFIGKIDFSTECVIDYYWDINETPEIIFDEFPQTIVKKININFKRDSVSLNEVELYNNFLYGNNFAFANFGSACEKFLDTVSFVSTVSYFDHDEYIHSYCNDGEFLISGKKLIPSTIPTTSSNSSKLGGGAIAAIVISVIIVLVISMITIIYVYHKYKKNLPEKSDILSMGNGLLKDSDSGAIQKFTESL